MAEPGINLKFENPLKLCYNINRKIMEGSPMKMYEVLALQNFYASIQDKRMPIKTAYKLSRLAKRAEEEIQFYQKEFAHIVDEYALKKDG